MPGPGSFHLKLSFLPGSDARTPGLPAVPGAAGPENYSLEVSLFCLARTGFFLAALVDPEVSENVVRTCHASLNLNGFPKCSE